MQEWELPSDRPQAVFPCACYLLLWIWYLLFRTCRFVFGIWYLVFGTYSLIFITWYLVLWQKWEVPSDRPGAVFPCGEPVEPSQGPGWGEKAGKVLPGRPPAHHLTL